MREQIKDQVCGMEVGEDNPFTAERAGKTSYFCSSACRESFLKGEKL